MVRRKNKWKNNEKECIINEKTTNKKRKFQNKTGGLRNGSKISRI